MAGFIAAWMIYAFAALTAIIILSIIYAIIKGAKSLKSSFKYFLISSMFIDAGIIIHTHAFLEYGSVTTQTWEFVTGHILLLIGFIVLAMSSEKIKKLSEEIGFGGK